jgi:SSS family solute:Na+ symporter
MPALTIMACIFVPYYLRNQIRTIPELLEKRFGGGSRALFAGLSVVVFSLLNLPGVLYGSGLALNAIFGIDVYTGIIILASVAAIYVVPADWQQLPGRMCCSRFYF